MYDENIAVENFITFCDNMMIVEESAIGDIKKVTKPMKRQLEDLKIKIRESDGNPREQIRYYKEALSIITKVENQVNSIHVSKFEENARIAGAFIAALLPISLEIVHAVKSGTGDEPPSAVQFARLAGEVGIAATAAAKASSDLSSKGYVLAFINKEKSAINSIIRYLESENSSANEGFIDTIKKRHAEKKERKQKVKDANDYQNELLRKSREADYKAAIPYLKKITEEIRSKCMSKANANKLHVDFSNVQSQNEGRYAYSYFSYEDTSGDNGNMSDIVEEVLRDVLKRYQDIIDKYNIDRYWEHTEVGLHVYF